MKLYCVADEDTVRGFRLAGIEGRAVATPAEATAAVDGFAAQADCGVLVLTQDLAESIRPRIETLRHDCERPLVVEIPGPRGARPGHRSLQRVVQEAVGIPFGGEDGPT